MKQIADYSDERHKAWCIHCGAVLANVDSNKDHVPSKSLLDKEYPADLPTVRICRPCNTSFSIDEEYFVAFLGSVLAGSAEAEDQVVDRAEVILRANHRLQDEIERQLVMVDDGEGGQHVTFVPDQSRIENVVVKNARGHALFEVGEPMLGEPAHVAATPLMLLSEGQRSAFLAVGHGPGWPEVGSRALTRMVEGHDMDEDGWVIVQPGTYRYAVMHDGRLIVRSLIREYLATEVIWDE